MENSFEVWIDNRTHQVFGNNFSQVLSTDPKFQHLYSEWVKKEVGIEDENVELEFNRAIIDSRLAGDDVYIDFSKITSLENIEEQVCKNTKNYYIKSIDVRIIDENSKAKWFDTAKIIKDKYVKNISNSMPSLIFNNKIIVKLYYYDVDLVYDRYNRSKMDKNETNFYYIQFDLKNNSIKYMSDYCDNTYATVLENWLKDIENE